MLVLGNETRPLSITQDPNDPSRAAQWAAVWMVGEACETWREDSDDVQAWVRGDECQALLASCRAASTSC